MRVRKVGSQLQSLAILHDRFFDVAFLAKCVPDTVMTLGMIELQLERLAIFVNRGIGLPILQKGVSKIDVRLRVTGKLFRGLS